ncbi:MAG: hypothetical protein M3312_04305 [Actinomycetota bacterium]|nr:hypothetical protein [Actinomycetota bacterium]
MTPIDRPLALGELLARTAEIYGRRIWAALALGSFLAAMILGASAAPEWAGLTVVAFGFTACYAVSARLIAGDAFGEAFAQAAFRFPVLVVLTIVVSVPLALALANVLMLLFVVAWIALTGFSIPVAMLERNPDSQGFFAPMGHAMTRAIALARVEYLHAAGVVASLAVIYVFIGNVLASALVGFAEAGSFGAFLLVQMVLAPFFFLGLGVLYFEQKARALSSRSHE